MNWNKVFDIGKWGAAGGVVGGVLVYFLTADQAGQVADYADIAVLGSVAVGAFAAALAKVLRGKK